MDHSDADMRRVRWLVSGRVQGVGFRYHVTLAGRDDGLAGDVRNLPDGRVEVRAEGTPEALARLRSAVRAGPPGARVEEIRDEPLGPEERLGDFDIRY